MLVSAQETELGSFRVHALKIIEHLEHQVVSGLLIPGSRLPSERVLSKRFSCSRQTVREALAELRSRGIIETRHGQGSTLLGFIKSNTGPIAPFDALYTSDPGLLYDVLDIREVLESKAAALAAERASLRDRYRIEQAYSALLKSSSGSDSTETHASADFAFHKSIAEASQSPVLAHTLDGLSRLFARSVKASADNLYMRRIERDKINVQHEAIFNAISTGDSDAAGAAARKHIESVRRSLAEIERAESILFRI